MRPWLAARLNAIAAEFDGEDFLSGLIFDLRFSLFFFEPERPTLHGALRAARRMLIHLTGFRSRQLITIVRPELSANPLPCIVLAVSSSAAHYCRLEAQLRQLLLQSAAKTETSVILGRVDKRPMRVGTLRGVGLAWEALLSALRAGLRLRQAGILSLPTALTSLCGGLNLLMDYIFNRRVLNDDKTVSALLVVNENWMPEAQLLRAARSRGIPTFHYPHGMIGTLILPLVSDHQLFWNSVMAKTFEPDKPRSASVVGGLESYKILSISDRARTLHYDVLITSQIHGFRLGLTDSPYSLREIFLIWREVMHSIRGLRCAVKLHPSESEVDRNLIANIFFDVRERLTIEDGKSDLHSLLERSKVHSTVSSGAVVLAAKLRKRSLVYGHSKLFSDNLPEICEIFGSAAEAVALLQRDNAPGPNGHWLNDDWIENRFCELVPNMAMGRREGARWPELVGSAAVRRDARLPQGRLTDR